MEALVRKRYEVGKRLLDPARKADANQSETDTTDVPGPSPASRRAYLNQCRRFAQAYTPEELEELLALRTSKHGTPLGWAHVLQLMPVKDKALRRELELQAARESWSARGIATFRREKVGGEKRSKGARPLTEPKNLNELVQRLETHVHESQRHLSHWTESHLLNQPFSTMRLRRSLRLRVQAIRGELTILVKTAKALSRRLEPIAAGGPELGKEVPVKEVKDQAMKKKS
jgi:hypothetical protein